MSYNECHGHIFMDGHVFKEAMELHKNGVVREVSDERLALLREAGPVGAGIVRNLVQEQRKTVFFLHVLPTLVEGGIGVCRLPGHKVLQVCIEEVRMDEETAFGGVCPQFGGVLRGRGAGNGRLEEVYEGSVHNKKETAESKKRKC